MAGVLSLHVRSLNRSCCQNLPIVNEDRWNPEIWLRTVFRTEIYYTRNYGANLTVITNNIFDKFFVRGHWLEFRSFQSHSMAHFFVPRSKLRHEINGACGFPVVTICNYRFSVVPTWLFLICTKTSSSRWKDEARNEQPMI